ncbi:MAG TPA: ATP synthase F0 subunit B [Vicinamibacterales bacterium]|nr:ATP synthase F0 subunit B [Vicinamibacterales bacterium]
MLPDVSVFWVILFVMLLTVIIDRLLLRPVLRVIQQREDAIRSAREMAERSANQARAAAAEFDQKTTAARGEIYKQMDEMRRAALAQRAELIAQTRAEADAQIAAASERLQVETEEARRRLEADADALGGAVAERILGRKVS